MDRQKKDFDYDFVEIESGDAKIVFILKKYLIPPSFFCAHRIFAANSERNFIHPSHRGLFFGCGRDKKHSPSHREGCMKI